MVAFGLALLGPAHAQGEWEGPFGPWDCCINPVGCTTGEFPEISHAALIPKGPYVGRVLFWNRAMIQQAGSCVASEKVVSWIWDPLSPDQITGFDQTQLLPGDIFCGGMSWDSRGSLVVAGGNRPQSAATSYLLQEIVRFMPSVLTAVSGNLCCGAAPCTGGGN